MPIVVGHRGAGPAGVLGWGIWLIVQNSGGRTTPGPVATATPAPAHRAHGDPEHRDHDAVGGADHDVAADRVRHHGADATEVTVPALRGLSLPTRRRR